MFQEFLEKHQLTGKKIAVGVSGGSDSLGLVLMIQEELAPLGYEIAALTVNHGLRPKAKEEALYVADVMRRFKIFHQILNWEGKKPETGVEEAARKARYALLLNWCRQNGFDYLVTAHHLLDEAETFLMRLERGSGLDGLCGMKEVSEQNGIKILRPLLTAHPQKLKTYLKNKQINWVEDESNACMDLLRVRIRSFLPEFEAKTGISALKIVQTMMRLQNSRTYFEDKIQSLIENNLKCWVGQAYCAPIEFFTALHPELLFRLLSTLLQKTGQNIYPPEAEKVLALAGKIKQPNFKAATLGHCRILLHQGVLWLVPEKVPNGSYSAKMWQAYLKEHPAIKKYAIPATVKRLLVLKTD